MLFAQSPRVQAQQERLLAFMDEHIYPNEEEFFRAAEQLGPWEVNPVIEELKPKARAGGLWNLFLPDSEYGAELSNFDYAPLCEIMVRSHLAPEVFNCSAPDTGNMEVLVRYGTEEQKRQRLVPLLEGCIRSAFAMTEPNVASSDATNIESTIIRDGDSYVVNGYKWYTTGATDPRCKVIIFMGKSDPGNPDRHRQHAIILVPKDTPGVRVIRPLPVFGFYGMPNRASGWNSRMWRAACQHDPRRGEGVRDRTGPPGSRAHLPLHAPDRAGRAHAGKNVPPCVGACGVW
jgi:acyl-CoA dehydrogenase